MLKLDRQFGLYVIREPLVIGSSKASCRAEDPFFDRDVILKLVGPEEVGSRENLDLLAPYLDSLAGLEHPAISPFYDSGIEGESCYFTTAFYPDGCLADQLTQPMEVGKTLQIILQLSSALAYAYNEGFEHGKLTLKDIFFASDGHAVICDFGIAATIHRLRQKGEVCITAGEKGLRPDTFRSLGEILVKLLLGPAAKPDAVSTALLKQSHSRPIVDLATDLLALGEHELSGFDELLKRLTDLAVAGPDAGLNQYIEYVEQTDAANLGANLPGIKPALTPSQRQLEIKEAVYAKDEIRRLVAEKSKLQEILSRAVSYKKRAELKLESGACALQEAKKAEAKALSEAKLALAQLARQRQSQWHPAFWLAGGVLAGSLITGSYSFHLAHQQALQAPLATQQTVPLTPEAPPAPAVHQSTAEATPATAPIVSQAAPAEQLRVAVEPEPENTNLWWPAGHEFDTAAALPVAMAANAQLNTSATAKREALEQSLVVAATIATTVTDASVLADADNEVWWPAGNEFDMTKTPDSMASAAPELCQEALCVVQNWAKAWSNKDLDTYFSFYSEAYRPEIGRSLEEWRAIRLARLTRPQWIKVMIGDFQIRSVGEDRVQIKLRQNYSSDYYQDEILKSLNLVKENGQWRILTERSLGFLNVSNPGDMIGG